MNETMISVDIMPALSALCGSDAAALAVGRTPFAEPHPPADAVAAFQTAMSSLVAENREVQVALEKVVPLPLEIPTPVVQTSVAQPPVETPVVQTPVAQTPVETPVVQTPVDGAAPVVQTPVVKPEVPITPEIVREFAEVIAPLVAENREVQVALEKVVPLPLEVPAPTVKPEAVAVKGKVPSVDSPEAEAVLQAAPVALPTQVETVVRPDMERPAIAEVEAPSSAPKVAPTPSEVLIAAAEAVADTIMVTPGLLAGEGQIRVQLRPDVLAGTEIQINVTGKAIAVEFLPQTTDMGVLIQRCLPQLEQHLAARIHSFTIAATVGTIRRRKV